MHFDFITFIGLIGGAFYLASHYMRAMVPLRILSLVSNILLIIFSVFHLEFDWAKLIVSPEFLLNSILLPMNAKRLVEIMRLTREIEKVTEKSPVSEWLLPHMHMHKHHAGHVLFREGDKADEIYYVASGTLRLEGIGATIGPDNLVGEIALFSPSKKRTLTVVCETDCELYMMTAEQIYQLYYQNPKLGFYFMKLIVERLLRDVERHKAAALAA
ncbi:MAG TPA: cyclic nucleotide-binding domain-containing protein [Rubrivivax sp.]|nr:cyclic nucleotide-binding domain-containing protein [Rubrivivax sp.]